MKPIRKNKTYMVTPTGRACWLVPHPYMPATTHWLVPSAIRVLTLPTLSTAGREGGSHAIACRYETSQIHVSSEPTISPPWNPPSRQICRPASPPTLVRPTMLVATLRCTLRSATPTLRSATPSWHRSTVRADPPSRLHHHKAYHAHIKACYPRAKVHYNCLAPMLRLAMSSANAHTPKWLPRGAAIVLGPLHLGWGTALRPTTSS